MDPLEGKATYNLRLFAGILMFGGLVTLSSMWAEIRTQQIETWVTRAYDSFVLLNALGKFGVAEAELTEEAVVVVGDVEDANGDGDGDGKVEANETEEPALVDSETGQGQPAREFNFAAEDIWKFLMSDEATRNCQGGVVPWSVIRSHPYVVAAAEANADIVDVFTENFDIDGPGVPLRDFLMLCGACVRVCVCVCVGCVSFVWWMGQ